MNYFSHGIRYLDRPYFLAGTAVPDWIRVSDQGIRIRARNVEPFATGDSSDHAELAAGIMQHLNDDDLFHGNGTFIQICAQLSILFRAGLKGEEGMRPSFLGHIVSELLLDAILIERHPQLLTAYYEALLRVDPELVQTCVSQMTKEPAQRLGRFITLFHREQFLWDYRTASGLLGRLNQVMRRVNLPVLPYQTVELLDAARKIVESHFEALLPFEFSPAN